MSSSYTELVKDRILAGKLIKRLDERCQSTEAQRWNEAVIEMQKATLERHWSSFQTKQLAVAELPSISEEARSRNEAVAIKVANLYFNTKQRLISLMGMANPNHNRPLLKVSEIKLSKFNGDYTKWTSWRAQFVSKVLDTELPPGSKIDLLLTALESEARKCAGEAEHRDKDDLDRIWKKLGDTYDNPYQIVTAHINQLIDIPTMEFGQSDKLRLIIDTVEQEMRSLNRFNCNTEAWSPFMAVYILRKLDKSTRAAWEMDRNPTEPPSLTQLLPFLERRIFAMRNLKANRLGAQGVIIDRASNDEHLGKRAADTNGHRDKRFKFSSDLSSGQRDRNPFVDGKTGGICAYCKGSHRTWNCEKLASIEYNERVNKIKDLKLCESCLADDHTAQNCQWRGCKVCDYAKHNRMNCPKYPVMRVNYTRPERSYSGRRGRTQRQVLVAVADSPTISTDKGTKQVDITQTDQALPIIGTALCHLRQSTGTVTGSVRLLCDSGSQLNLITQECVQRWGLERMPRKISIAGVGDAPPLQSLGYIDCMLCHRDNSAATLPVRFVIVKRISGKNPQRAFKCRLMSQLRCDELADPTFAKPGPVEGLIGISTWASIIRDDIIRSYSNIDRFIAQRSMLGWVVSGCVSDTESLCSLSLHVADPCYDLDKKLELFWAVDDGDGHRLRTPEEELAERCFASTHTRDEKGRYIVKIPLKEVSIPLGRSRQTAFNRFVALETRLKKNADMASAYWEFMQDYVKEGHIVPAPPAPEDPSLSYYIPYHIISNKKFRVVFDASCVTSTGVSFNDLQLPGEKLQADLYETLLLFRTYRFALTADIIKMFRQVKVHPDHWNFQRIFFRTESNQPIGEYYITRVIWGFTSSGFNAVRALQQCARDEAERYPAAAAATLTNFYMDDFLGGAESIEELETLYAQMIDMLKAGGFQLSKWATSNTEFAKRFVFTEPREIGLQNKAGILGMVWDPNSDNFYIKIHGYPVVNTGPFTKRQIISHIAQVYDPTGIYAPVIIAGKIVIQEVWKLNLGWDDIVTDRIMNMWEAFQQSVIDLADIPVPRWIAFSRKIDMQLHLFSDASKSAYGTCAYLRSIQEDGSVMVRLITSRNKVAPTRLQSIPRLELMAAVMSTDLCKFVRRACKLHELDIYYWSDSTIVLYWLRKNLKALKPFVANRVSSILSVSDISEWRHVPGDQNPADLLSRGCNSRHFKDCQLWWHGPPWLRENTDRWPRDVRLNLSPQDLTADEVESRVVLYSAHISTDAVPTRTMLTIGEEEPLVERCSTLNKLLRTTAFVFRFWDAVKNKKRGDKSFKQSATFQEVPPVSPSERDRAAKYWSIQSQIEFFSTERKSLLEEKDVRNNSKLVQLSPFIDKEHVLRVGGRLGKSSLPLATKHQIILHPTSTFARLVITDAHSRAMHGGAQLTIAIVRQMYWIPNLRVAVKKVISNCIICVRFKKEMAQQMMGAMPTVRTERTFAFASSGVDFAGPFEVRKAAAPPVNLRQSAAKSYRPPATIKCWVVVFVCMATRAVHLDLAHGLSVEAFLEVFARFVSRRGHCSKLHSDNGTNFVGSNKELQRVRQEWKNKFPLDELANLGTIWKFNAPAAPHQGGLWEAGVKSMKYHLRRVIGRRILSVNQFYTILTQIECCLNSRPLSPLTDDHTDLEVLTAGHFLAGRSLMHHPPAEDVADWNDNRLTLWGQQQKLTQLFWRRWKDDYLISLQKRSKWYHPQKNIKPGDMVLVLEESRPPAIWPVGRVERVHPGADGLVRNVSVRTSTGIRDRPVQKLCLLPIESKCG